MTESGSMESSASANPWNPASRDFWGSEPEKKFKQLFNVAILGLILTAFSTILAYDSYALSLFDLFFMPHVPLFHCFILLWAVKTSFRPSNDFRALLGLLIIWSIIKILVVMVGVFASGLWLFYANNPSVLLFLGVTIMLNIWFIGITFLLWKHTGDQEFHGPSSDTVLIFIFITLFMTTFSYILWLDEILGSSFYLLHVFAILGFLLFWGAFTILYIYRTEIEPWRGHLPLYSQLQRDANTPYNLGSHETRPGISVYAASKLKEAKELLDNGIISVEEFQQIKNEYLK